MNREDRQELARVQRKLGYTEDEIDMVNHPPHYKGHPSGIECIEITRHMTFNCGNAIKYIWRNGIKDSNAQVEDLEKAIFYLKDEVMRLSKDE